MRTTLPVQPPTSEIAQPQREVTPPSLLRETDDDYWKIPWLTLNNVDQCTAEINRQGIRRIRLHHIYDSRKHHAELLEQLGSRCPGIRGIYITDWQFSTSDLGELLTNLPQLTHLHLSSCRIAIAAEGAANEFDWIPKRLGITSLTMSSCHGIRDEAMRRLLDAMPQLEELSVSDAHWTGDVFHGKGWPLAKLTRLQKLSISSLASDGLIGRVLVEIPHLKTLRLWHCDGIVDATWVPDRDIELEQIEVVYCETISDATLSSLLQKTPRLTSLRITGCDEIKGDDLDLTRLTRLRHLHVSGRQLNGDFVLRAIRANPDLESLSIRSVYPSDESESFDFSSLKKLRTLSFGPCRVALSVLTTLPESIESLEIQRCDVTNSSVATMLRRLTNLHTLKIDSLYGRLGSPDDPISITGAGWDFGAQQKLRHLEIWNCSSLTDPVVARVTDQLPKLESLNISSCDLLTGEDWDLERLESLQSLELNNLERMQNTALAQLPKSLASLKISRCPMLNGKSWNLVSLTELTTLEIRDCASLTSLGERLPGSLRKLHVQDCRGIKGSELSYAGLDRLERLSFKDCHLVDVGHLFAELPRHTLFLRTLDATGCPNVTTVGWDMSPLTGTILEIMYPEGEPAYVGGIDESNWRILKQQLPNASVVR